MDYDELLTTTTTTVGYFTDHVLWDDNMETTTIIGSNGGGDGLKVENSRVLGLYDIFIPLLGVFIIVLNLAVVVSSGLILKRGE